jgi:hypothetical protein
VSCFAAIGSAIDWNPDGTVVTRLFDGRNMQIRHTILRVDRAMWPMAMLATAIVSWACWVTAARAHGSEDASFRSKIVAVEPEGLPIDVRIVRGDQLRFENAGDERLVLCGYAADRCEEWVRIGPKGVFVDEDSKTFWANAEGDQYGAVPQDAGANPNWVLERERPPFFAYHDHRVHWMGATLPPGVDEGDPSAQRVLDGEVAFRYGDTDGIVRTQLDYVGGQTWLQRNGELLIVAAGVTGMLVLFAIDARRRRRRSRRDVPRSAEPGTGADDGT